MANFPTVDLFGISIHQVTMTEAVAQVRALARGTHPTFVVTPNVDHVVKLQDDAEFRRLYSAASLVIADGMPIVWVSRWVKNPVPERVTGADLFLEVCQDAQDQGLTIYLLGAASQDIIERTAAGLKDRFPGLTIAGAHSPSFGFEKSDSENLALVERIRRARPDILFVGVGAPKQEKWIARFLEPLGVPVSLGVGAAFDFVAGSVNRAPVWMQKSGLEWFYRFLKEPKRMFKRYFVDDFRFLGLALAERKKARSASKISH